MTHPELARKPRPILTRKFIFLATAALTAIPAFAGPLPTPNFTAQNLPGDGSVPSGNFENPPLATHVVLTSWNGWTMSGPTGIVKEGATFASAYPDIPGGAYALFLQGSAASATHTFSKNAGLWRFSFDAGQRNQNQTQIVRVKINGQSLFQQIIAPGLIKRYATRPFRHSGGPLTVEIEGLQAGDNTALVDALALETVGAWSNAATWGGAGIPNQFSDVVNIPPNVRVAFTENRTEIAGDIHVQGFLGALDGGDSRISCRTLLVDGADALFQVGSDGSRHQSDFTITLETNDTVRDLVGFGNKFLGAKMGGALELHGKSVTSYAKLNQTVSSGNTIDVRNMSGWGVNDEIVITSTDSAVGPGGTDGWLNYEVFRITNIETINPTVTRLTLNGNIQKRHLGVDQTYQRTAAPSATWNFETRAYVGLISRNIRVQGILGTETGFGGHIMIMGAHNGLTIAGEGRLSHVELFNMGQKTNAGGGLLGRYPFHWHMLANAGTGQYIKNCSIHRSFNRAITVHGTHNTLVSNNVAFDHLGHGIFFEDGSEENNTVDNNLVLLTRKPQVGKEVIPSDNSKDEPQNRSPSSFWISNPKNIINGNIAAGTEGVGYWFALSDGPTGPSAADPRFNAIEPRFNSITSFQANRSNSSMMALDINDAVDPLTFDILKNVPYRPDTLFQEITQLKVYGNDTGIYTGLGSDPDELVFNENEFVENRFHTFLASYQEVSNSLFVDKTVHGIMTGARTAIRQYDGPGTFTDNHFHGYNAADATIFEIGGGAVNRTNWRSQGASYNHAGLPRVAYGPSNESGQMDSVIDLDGTLTGTAGRKLVTPHPILRTPFDPVSPAHWSNAFVSSNRFVSTITIRPDGGTMPNLTFTRVDTVNNARVNQIAAAPASPNQMAVLIASNPRYDHEVAFSSFPAGKAVNFIVRDAGLNDYLMLKFMGLGGTKMGVVENGNPVGTLAALDAANATSYFRDAANLHIKIVFDRPKSHFNQGTNIRWE